MKPENLTLRILAVVLSAGLILPPHAYALRTQQREAEPQRAGLEEVLRSGDPDALVRVASSRLAQWIAPAPAAVPGLLVEGSSAVPIGRIQAGLEEAERIAKQYETLLAELSEKPDQPIRIAQLKGELADPSNRGQQVIAARVLIEQMMVDLADPDYYYQLDRSDPKHPPVYRDPRPGDRKRIQGDRQEAVETRLKALRILKENERQLLPPAPNDLKDYIDLQVHTFLSDGSQSPSAVIFEAWRGGMKAVGINDHNTFDHFEEAIRAGEILGITVYPSIELDLVDPDLWKTAQNAHVLVYFPVRSIQELETIRGRLEGKRGIDPAHPSLNLFELAELRLKWNLMKQHEIIRRFNEKYNLRMLTITSQMIAFRMGGHPNFAMIAAILKANFTATQLKSGINGVLIKGTAIQYDENKDARELAKKIVRSDPEVYVDFSDPLFANEGIPTLPGTDTRLFGLPAQVLDPLRQGNFGAVAVLPHPNEEVRFWIKQDQIQWQEVQRVTGMNQSQYLTRFPLRDGKVWITPALFKKFHLDGIELSGKKGELPAEEIRKLIDFLGADPDTFLVTVGSDTHYNEFDEAGGYQLGKGMSLGHGRWSLSKTTVRKVLRGAGLNPYDEIHDRMRQIFQQRAGLEEEQAVEKIVGNLQRQDSGVGNALNQVLEWVSKRDSLPPVLRQEIANQYQTFVDLVRKTAAEYRASETEGYSPRELANSNWPWDPEGDSERAQRTTTEVRELAQRVLDALTQVSFAGTGLEEGTPITKEMAAGIVRDWGTLNEIQRDQVVADLAKHDYTQQKYRRHRDLIRKGEQGEPAAFMAFPPVVDGKPGSADQKRLLALGSRPDVLGKEGVIIAAAGEGTRLLENSIKDGLLPPNALALYTKPTAPVTPITGTSTLVYQLQVLADEAATQGVSLPVRVVLHEEVGTKVAKMIEQNDNFRLPHLELVYQGMNAALDSDGKIVLRDDKTVSMNPDGTGGVVRAALQNGGNQWFASILGSNAHLTLINGDMLLEPELIHLMAGAGRETPVVGVGYAYPPGRNPEDDHKAKLGTFGVLEQDGRRLVKIVEYRERGSVGGFNEAVQQEEAADGTAVQANSGLYGFPLEGLLAKTQYLPLHHQKDKDAIGVTGRVQKVEEFATDIPAEYDADQVGVLSVDPAILTPIKDPAGLRKVREMAIARERQRAEALGITPSPAARVEFHPAMNRSGRIQVGRDVRVEGSVGVYFHPGGVRLYTQFQPAKPWEPFDPEAVINFFPTQPGEPVVIPDGTVFSAGLEESQVGAWDLMPLRGADYFAALGGTSAPFVQLAGEAFLKQEGVLEAIEAGGGVLSLGAEAATRLLGRPAVGAMLIRDGTSPPRMGLPATPDPNRIILADEDIPARENWPWVKVGDWPELRQALLSADPRDYLFVEEEPGLTRGVVEAALREAFPQGRMPLALLGSAEAYGALPDNALDLLGRAGQPPVVMLRVEMELKSRSGETFHLIVMV